MDVKSLYTNINHDDALNVTREALNERKSKEVPTELVVRLLEMVLKYNIFEFNEELYIQDIGGPMGSAPVPSYANIFMARAIDKVMKRIDPEKIKLHKRFLDDIFLIYCGTTKGLHKFFDEVNKINSSIQMTMSHTSLKNENSENKCDCKETEDIQFLDLSCSIKEGKIETDLFRKQTDRNQYLLPSSCHPRHTTRSIPISLATRVLRNCSNPEKREKRFKELKI